MQEDGDISHPFDCLTPEFILNAIEAEGYLCDGRIFPLNSYENRVYQVGIEDAEPLVAKFYRPQRWNAEQILEEHDFTFELASHELPVVTPIRNADGTSLCQSGDFWFALYSRKGGHAPELDQLDNLFVLGRLIGRIHAVAATRTFNYRPTLDVESYGDENVSFLLDKFIPNGLQESYATLTNDLLAVIREQFGNRFSKAMIRTHGDCHIGNMLWRDESVHFVDFDDARMAPAVQDIWMLLSGDRAQRTRQLNEIVEGYEEFFDFPVPQLAWIEGLRSLRIINYCGWLARRWDDPAFPRSFPWFNTERFWGEHILELREQLAEVGEPPLSLPVR